MRAPVAIFAFNRPEPLARVFAAVRAAKPSRLFLVCDGPRTGNASDAAQCAAVRQLLDGVDWPCEVERNYADANMGCRNRVSSGIDWVFSRTDEAVFLEDDTLPDASFFPYCDELLAKYRDDARVLMVSGYNMLGHGAPGGASYWFSSHPRIWGWASWRRAWSGYDVTMSDWPAFKHTPGWLARSREEQLAWGGLFDAVKAGTVDTWDAQVLLHAWRTGALTVIPATNLVTNIGFGADATHTHGPAAFGVGVRDLEFPLVHPEPVERSEDLDAEGMRVEHAPGPGRVRRATRRTVDTLRHYSRRWKRWLTVLLEGRPGTAQPRPGSPRVLVVRLDAIGDFVLWTGAARALREWLGPDRHVTLAANAIWADLARDQGIADDVWPVDVALMESSAAYRAALRGRIADTQFSMAVNPRYTRELYFGDSVIRWSRAPVRVGMEGDDVLLPMRDRRRADRWYTTLFPTPQRFMHEAERNAGFLRSLGVPIAAVPQPELNVPPLAADVDPAVRGTFFVLAAGASAAEHRWPASRFAELARAIQARTGWTPVLIGDPRERALADEVAGLVPGAVNLTGKTTVREMVAVIARAKLVLSNDSAAVHIAAASGVHAICIAGGWHWDRFMPYPGSLGQVAGHVHAVSMVDEMPCFRCRGFCTLPHVAGEPRPCVDRVTVERAMVTVLRVLSLPEMQAPV